MDLFLALSSKIFLDFRQVSLRRERSDDRKCVCCSEATVKYAYQVDRFYHVSETDHVSNWKMVVVEMTSITVRWRDRVVPSFPGGKKNDFIGRHLIGLQTDLKIDKTIEKSFCLPLSTSLCQPPSPQTKSSLRGEGGCTQAN